MRKCSCVYKVDGFNRGTSVTFDFVPSPSPKYLKGSVLHSLHILLAPERLTFTLIERPSPPSSPQNPHNKTKTQFQNHFDLRKEDDFFFPWLFSEVFNMGWGTELLWLQRGKPFGSAHVLWWIWSVMLWCSIRVAAVIGAGGKVRAVSDQARGAGWVSPSMADQDHPCWLHVRPHVAATWFWCTTGNNKGQCH